MTNDDCHTYKMVLFGDVKDMSVFISTTVGMVIVLLVFSHTLYNRQRSWQIFTTVILAYFLMNFSVLLWICYSSDINNRNGFPPANSGGWFHFIYCCARTLVGVNLTYLALFDISMFTMSISVSLFIVGSWITVFFLWTWCFADGLHCGDSKHWGGYATEIGTICFAILELTWTVRHLSAQGFLVLVTGLVLGAGVFNLLKDNYIWLCDNPLWGFWTYYGLIYSFADMLFVLVWIYYILTRTTAVKTLKLNNASLAAYLKTFETEDDGQSHHFWSMDYEQGLSEGCSKSFNEHDRIPKHLSKHRKDEKNVNQSEVHALIKREYTKKSISEEQFSLDQWESTGSSKNTTNSIGYQWLHDTSQLLVPRHNEKSHLKDGMIVLNKTPWPPSESALKIFEKKVQSPEKSDDMFKPLMPLRNKQAIDFDAGENIWIGSPGKSTSPTNSERHDNEVRIGSISSIKSNLRTADQNSEVDFFSLLG